MNSSKQNQKRAKQIYCTKAYKNLKKLSAKFSSKNLHLKNLIKEKNRFKDFSIKTKDIFYDFSKQRLNHDVLKELYSLADQRCAMQRFSQMVSGKIVNTSERRAALHTALRDFTNKELFIDNMNIIDEISNINQSIKTFVQKIHDKKIKSCFDKPFTDAVIVGIGGSYLGCNFVYNAFKHIQNPIINLHFLSNVDIDNFAQIQKKIKVESTLWIIISKSYTTTETIANLEQVLLLLKTHSCDPSKQIVTITSKGSPGDDPSNKVLKSFHMFDFIGGRYSISSAVGGLALSLAFGFDVFMRFLKGCHKMDLHSQNALPEQNIPLTAALINIWNSNFLHYQACAIIPYSNALSKLASHVQQLYMESLGKQVDIDGNMLENKDDKNINIPTGVIIFGEPGTNAQHSFFQLAHQGRQFVIEFIASVNPCYKGEQAKSKEVYNHQELWANMIAQANALAIGKDDDNKAKYFSGNRPSSTMIINNLAPENIGQLLSFYEAKTVYEGFILNINPFDQFGVELGKKLASNVREHIKTKNHDRTYDFASCSPDTKFYLDTLFKGSF